MHFWRRTLLQRKAGQSSTTAGVHDWLLWSPLSRRTINVRRKRLGRPVAWLSTPTQGCISPSMTRPSSYSGQPTAPISLCRAGPLPRLLPSSKPGVLIDHRERHHRLVSRDGPMVTRRFAHPAASVLGTDREHFQDLATAAPAARITLPAMPAPSGRRSRGRSTRHAQRHPDARRESKGVRRI
jgi:hypothetical protein